MVGQPLRAHTLEMNGDSYRLKTSKQRRVAERAKQIGRQTGGVATWSFFAQFRWCLLLRP